MEYRLLGSLEVLDDAGRPLPLGGGHQRSLLALLLLAANRVVPAERLADELWGGRPPATAATAVQVYVSRLRKLLPEGTLVTRTPGYVLLVDPDGLDLTRFERLAAEGRRQLAAGRAADAARLLHAGLALWRGPPLADLALEPFAQPEILRLEELHAAAVEDRMDADLAAGRHAQLVPELEALLVRNPLRERLAAQLMLALYRSGRQADALGVYGRVRQRLLDALGIAPGPALRRLHTAILRQDPELEPAAGPARLERAPAAVVFAVAAPAGEKDPERVRALLERAYEAAASALAAAGAHVERGVAGAVLGVLADDPQGALDAAADLRAALADELGDRIAVRIAVDLGEVLVERGGGPPTGPPVARAARLVREAGPGEIVVGEELSAALERFT